MNRELKLTVRKNNWSEAKFQKELPSCRALHAEYVFQERLYIYGGTDFDSLDAKTDEVWFIDPLVEDIEWRKIKIVDEQFSLPDGIKGHSLGMRVFQGNSNKILLVVGGQRSFIKAEQEYIDKVMDKKFGAQSQDTFETPYFIYGI